MTAPARAAGTAKRSSAPPASWRSLFWCTLTRGEDHAPQQPSLTKRKLRRLEITAGAPRYANTAAGIWSSNDAERELAEISYQRMVKDQLAGAPARKVGASATPEHA